MYREREREGRTEKRTSLPLRSSLTMLSLVILLLIIALLLVALVAAYVSLNAFMHICIHGYSFEPQQGPIGIICIASFEYK